MDKQRFCILAVDDEPVNIQLMIAALKDDYEILTALSGQDAIELLEEQLPDLILLDVMMPDVSGYDVCRIIKADKRFVEIPVIFLTSLDSYEGELQGLELGGIDYLTKPTNFDLLKLRIRNHIVQKTRNDLMKEQVVQLARQKEELAQMLAEAKHAEEEKLNIEFRLHQSQKMEAIGQLAGGVAHDFNNKLMAILGNAQLAKMDIHDSDKVLRNLDEIRRAAEHSRDITYRLLAFSRQQVVTPRVLEANKVIAEGLKSLARLIGEHISISFEPCDKLWNIRMDPVQLDQIVMNLAINARDAMPDGGAFVIETGNITLDAGSCCAVIDAIPGDYVMITFSDTGTGMDKETLAHIFEPFFTTKEVGKGTGLGLATIYGIIHQNCGFIDVTSNVGQGTEFKVYIPRMSAAITESAKIADTISTGSCAILLVEDDDAVRIVVSLFLKKIGYTVHAAANPTVALELARDLSIQIDLVLTDYVMPGMSGRVMMEQILKLRPLVPCIYASGYSTEHVQLSKEAHFIQKPYDLIKLSGFIKRVINGSEEQ
ncbi:MAG TPA: response regulator [Desulfuromonadales bacterium]|nr:response regulator [Desulfuromonadales bacterium]